MTRVTTIHAPVEGYTGVSYIGPLVVEFEDGQATIEGDLPPGVAGYLQQQGYGIDGHPTDPPPAVEAPDPRDTDVEQVGTRLRDAAVDPRPEDFLPPTNAGEANPHGPDVVSPGIHGLESKAIVPGEVAGIDGQEERETELADRTLADDESVLDVTDDLAESADERLTEAEDAALVRPQKNDSTAAWRDYAVNSGAMSREKADTIGRDAIIAELDA